MSKQEPITEQKLKSIFTRFLKESHPRALRTYQESLSPFFTDSKSFKEFFHTMMGNKVHRSQPTKIGTYMLINNSFTWSDSEWRFNMPKGFWYNRDCEWNNFIEKLSKGDITI